MARSKSQPDAETYLLTLVKRVIDKVDPESLLKLGAPEDEYNAVSATIAQEIAAEGVGRISRTGLANIVALAFHVDFEPWSTPVILHGIYFDIADQLLPLLGENHVPSNS